MRLIPILKDGHSYCLNNQETFKRLDHLLLYIFFLYYKKGHNYYFRYIIYNVHPDCLGQSVNDTTSKNELSIFHM